jgi:hypothetical protein
MSRVPWHLFKDRQPRAHLVVAVLRADHLGGEPNPRAAQIVLARIVKIQKPSSYYATTVVREAGRPQVHLAFEDKGDARKLAATVEAEPTNTYPGWATEWTLQLDSATVLALAATLPAPRTRPRQPPPAISEPWRNTPPPEIANNATGHGRNGESIVRRVPDKRPASAGGVVAIRVEKRARARGFVAVRAASAGRSQVPS